MVWIWSHDLHLETWSSLRDTICSCFVCWADVYSFVYLAIRYIQRQIAREVWSSHGSKYEVYPDERGRASETSVHIYRLYGITSRKRRRLQESSALCVSCICIHIHGIYFRYKMWPLWSVTVLKELELYTGELWTVQCLKVLMWAEPVAADASRCLCTVANLAPIPLVCHSLTAVQYRVIHKSLRDFRTRLRNNQDRHGRKEHINR